MRTELTDAQYERYYRELIPYGSLDVYEAITVAIEAGKTPEWAAQQVIHYVEQCDMKIEDVDPVYVVYEGILQEVREDIEEHTKWDLCDDREASGPIYTSGNYCATSYDYSTDAKEELCKILGENLIKIEDLSDTTQWFLQEIYIKQEDVDKYIVDENRKS